MNKKTAYFWGARPVFCAVFLTALTAAAAIFGADNVALADSGDKKSGAAKTYNFSARSSKFKVIDGDTVHYGRLKIRLCGIQAPERETPLFGQTTTMLKNLIGRKNITAHAVTVDKYKRKVAVLYAGSEKTSVNEKMVRQGGAKHYRRFSQSCAPHIFPAQLEAAEQSAKKQKRGIWGAPKHSQSKKSKNSAAPKPQRGEIILIRKYSQ